MMRTGRTNAFRCFLAVLAGLALLVSGGSSRAADDRPPAQVELTFDHPLDAGMAPFVLAAGHGLFATEHLAVSFHFADGAIQTWQDVTPSGPAHALHYASMASDSTGANLVTGDAGGDIYTSHDFGATWTDETPSGAAHHQNCAAG